MGCNDSSLVWCFGMVWNLPWECLRIFCAIFTGRGLLRILPEKRDLLIEKELRKKWSNCEKELTKDQLNSVTEHRI